MRSLPDLHHALCNATADPIRTELFPDAQADRDATVEDLRGQIANHPDNTD